MAFKSARSTVVIHKTSILEKNATAPPGTRVITADGLERLRTAIRSAAIALGDAGSWGDPAAVSTQLTHHQLTGPAMASTYGVPPAGHNRSTARRHS